jgi:hypothetical protein
MKRWWSASSDAARSDAAQRRAWVMPPTIEQATENKISVLRFDEWGKKVSRLSRNEIDKNLAGLTDPSNFAGRVHDAEAGCASWMAAHPTGWAGTTGAVPQNDRERQAFADQRAALGRDATYAERKNLLNELRK